MDRDVLTCQTEVTPSNFAIPNQPSRDELRRVCGDRKAKSLRGQNHRRIYADHRARGIYKRASGVTRVEGRIGLDDIIHQPTGLRSHRSDECADNLGGNWLFRAVKTCNLDYP